MFQKSWKDIKEDIDIIYITGVWYLLLPQVSVPTTNVQGSRKSEVVGRMYTYMATSKVWVSYTY